MTIRKISDWEKQIKKGREDIIVTTKPTKK